MKLLNIFLFFSLAVLCSFLITTLNMSHIIPNLLFTELHETTKYFWNKTNQIDRNIFYSHTHIPIINKEKFPFELLEDEFKTTRNF